MLNDACPAFGGYFGCRGEGNTRSTIYRRYTIVIVSVPPKPPRPSQGPQVPKPQQPAQPPKAPGPPAVDQSVPRPLGPKRVTRSIPVPAAAKGPAAEMDPDELLKQQLLADVVAHAKRETRAVMLARVMESYGARPFIVTLVAIVALIVTGYSYATRSDWVFGAPVAVSAEREAHVRFAMFLAMNRIQAYHDANLVYPSSLDEIGERWPGITYRAIGDTLVELQAQGDSGQVMTLRSDRDARAFVGLSPNALRRNIPGQGLTP